MLIRVTYCILDLHYDLEPHGHILFVPHVGCVDVLAKTR